MHNFMNLYSRNFLEWILFAYLQSKIFRYCDMIIGICLAMKKKACSSLESAQILINNKQSNASIHCSYYAVFQYMKYMLAHTQKNAISYENQDKPGDDSHEYIIEEIKKRIKDPKNGKNFVEGVRSLKKHRKLADYTTMSFSLDESTEQKQNAEGLITKLKTYFGNI